MTNRPDAVYVLVYTHRHGADVSVHATEQGATDAVVGIIREYLDEVPQVREAIEAMLDAGTEADIINAIEAYVLASQENLGIYPATVQP